MNTFGIKLKMTTFGESHGFGVGCVIDGVPANLAIDETFIQAELDRRRPGGNAYGTKRDEADRAEILSGLFGGVCTGAPIAILIRNTAQKSGDYDALKDVFRPSHADFSYFMKYGVRDHRGGGRTSARESAARVAAGAIAKLILREIGVKIEGGVFAVGGVECAAIDYDYARKSAIFSLDQNAEKAQIASIEAARNSFDSIGGVVKIRAIGVPAGIGEPLYGKLDALLSNALMGINAVKAVEIGVGLKSAALRGSENNDEIAPSGFLSNRSGGILGGVSNGETIEASIFFKPTPSIAREQHTIDKDKNAAIIEIKGRHDPCVAIRGSVVCEAMAALTIADLALCGLGARIEHLKAIYGGKCAL